METVEHVCTSNGCDWYVTPPLRACWKTRCERPLRSRLSPSRIKSSEIKKRICILPLSRKKDRKSFVFDSPSSLLSWGRPTGLAGDTREGESRRRRHGVAHPDCCNSGLTSSAAPSLG